MVDINKRNALKVIGGTAAIASIPSFAVAAGLTSNGLETADKIDVTGNAYTEMSATLSIDSVPTVTLSNHSKQSIELRHVYPGIVHAGEKTFDINSIFTGEAHNIPAGASRSFKIKATNAMQAEANFPRHLYKKQPQRVVAVKGTNHRGEFINSSRSFYA